MLSVQRINISLKKNKQKKKHSIQIFSVQKKKKKFNLVSFEGFPQKQRL